MADPQVQYWDSPLFISFLQDRQEEAGRVSVFRTILEDARRSRILVVVSAFVLAEVRPYADRYNQDHMDVVEELFHTNRPYLRPVALSRAIAQRAREIGEQHRNLSVADSVHIATAELERVSVLFTYDGVREQGMRRSGDMIRFSGMIGNPGLVIREPFVDQGPLFPPN